MIPLVPLQAALSFTVVALLLLVLAIVTVWQMVEIVDATEKRALTVLASTANSSSRG